VENSKDSELTPREEAPALWSRYEKFLRMKARQYYHANEDRCARAGVELADLVQESYFALVDAVKAYDPEKGWGFISYLVYPLKKRFKSMTGLRTPAQMKEPLLRAASLDKPLPGAEDITLADVIPCPRAEEELRAVEHTVFISELRQAIDSVLDQLTPIQRDAVQRYYFDGGQMKDIAAEEGKSVSATSQAVRLGVSRIRAAFDFDPFIIETFAYRRRGLNKFHTTFTSDIEEAIIRAEQRRDRQNRTRI
jgi:RNA polymerase sigma factor (sigma-70 family)